MYGAVLVSLLRTALLAVAPFELAPDNPSKHVSQLIEQLLTRRGGPQDIAADQLAGTTVAEPYVRFLPPAETGATRQKVAEVLSRLHDRACEHAIARHGADRAKAGRIDMLVELACLTRDEKLAGQLYDLTLLALDRYWDHPRSGLAKLEASPGLQFPDQPRYTKGVRRKPPFRVHDGELITSRRYASDVFIHSRTSINNCLTKNKWLCLVGDIISQTVATESHWHGCLIAVNNSMEFHSIDASMLIVDGDVTHTGTVNDSVTYPIIIARGSIHVKYSLGSGGNLLCAGKDIVLENGIRPAPGIHLYAGGRITTGKAPLPKGQVVAGSVAKEQADLSFTGIRFFELSDLGVAAAAHKDGAQITKLDANSPLKFYGLRVGDVVTKLNDQPMASVNEFRRHLRRSVALRAGIFTLKREGKEITRIVYLDGLLNSKK